LLFGLGEGGRERDDPGTALVVAATHPPAKTPPRQTRRRMTLTLAVLALAGVLSLVLVVVVADDLPRKGADGSDTAPPRPLSVQAPAATAPPAQARESNPPTAATAAPTSPVSRPAAQASNAPTVAPASAKAAGAAEARRAPAPQRPANATAATAAAAAATRPASASPDAGAVTTIAAVDSKPPPPLSAAELSRRLALVDRRSGDDESGWKRLVTRFTPTTGASVKGRVVDAETGRPVIGVMVEAHLGDSFMETTTDATGGFRLSTLLPGSRAKLWIVGKPENFVAESIDVALPGEGEVTDAGAIRVLRGDELASRLDGWVGLFVSRRGRRNVVGAVTPWLPADRAGIEVGDVLLSIDGRDVGGLGPRATSFLLRGPVGTTTSIVAQKRQGQVVKLSLARVLR
jgi:hypothetical protein